MGVVPATSNHKAEMKLATVIIDTSIFSRNKVKPSGYFKLYLYFVGPTGTQSE
ncbi:Uncharacterised protein [Serratia liquefaciens]|nr:Uncharacterised protein [Serratia liquefaciens]